MTLRVNTVNNSCESVDVHCSPVEWLILNKALRWFSLDKLVHPDDKKIAERMISVEPIFEEVRHERDSD